jgi:hypothetical protein
MDYRAIDPVIQAWAKAHDLCLLTDQGRCFCYTSSEDGECFQLVIEPPRSGIVRIDAWSIETSDDEELHRISAVPVADLAKVLEEAFQIVEDWKRGVGRLPWVVASS